MRDALDQVHAELELRQAEAAQTPGARVVFEVRDVFGDEPSIEDCTVMVELLSGKAWARLRVVHKGEKPRAGHAWYVPGHRIAPLNDHRPHWKWQKVEGRGT